MEHDLWRLCYFGGEADGRTWLKLVLERLYDAFDAEKQLDDLDWCAQYLLRHGRWGSLESIERLTRSELGRRMKILSEMIQAESKPAHARQTTSGRR